MEQLLANPWVVGISTSLLATLLVLVARRFWHRRQQGEGALAAATEVDAGSEIRGNVESEVVVSSPGGGAGESASATTRVGKGSRVGGDVRATLTVGDEEGE